MEHLLQNVENINRLNVVPAYDLMKFRWAIISSEHWGDFLGEFTENFHGVSGSV